VIGRELGQYTIVAPLGSGGMGEVYRAHDQQLVRDVAIKIIPPHLSGDADRRARFAREARLLAALNHPHIAAIYGVVDAGDSSALVLELVEGPTLESRLARDALPLSQALAIARQIAEALDAAHARGIVHRDLKPANIVLQGASDRLSGAAHVKVLDFGLAKTVAPDGEEEGNAVTRSGTVRGVMLGTPAYMSPEQARGLGVDKRTDIWAFGCVLFEMLAGRRAFGGTSVPDTLAAILDKEPPWTALPGQTPPEVRKLLERCLRKDPSKRLRDIGDALFDLDDVETHGQRPGSEPVASAQGAPRIAWAIAGLSLVGALAATAYLANRPSPVTRLEFAVVPPENATFTRETAAPDFAVSPDGRQIAAVARFQNVSSLWVRPVDRVDWRPLIGTEGATGPFWSPDSQALGFFAGEKLKTVRIAGGQPVVLCDTSRTTENTGGSWAPGDVILFSDSGSLKKVSASGGVPSLTVEKREGDREHVSPSFLPDGQHFLYLAHRDDGSELRIASLAGAGGATLGPFESSARYADGRLLFVRGGALMAQPFDANTRQLTGQAIILAPQAALLMPSRRAIFSVSDTGVLAYSRTARTVTQLTWIGRQGARLGAEGEPGLWVNLDLDPADRRVAISQQKELPSGSNVDIWIRDLVQGTEQRLTTDPAPEFDPAWSPDGSVIAFNSGRSPGRFSLFVRPSDRSGKDELLVDTQTVVSAPSWSRDGKFIVYNEQHPGTAKDLFTVDLSTRRPAVYRQTTFNEAAGVFAPNGQWIAFESDESGRSEVYIGAFPPAAGPIPISRAGGRAPRWRGDGRELFFLTPDGTMISASIEFLPGKAPVAKVPAPLFATGLVLPETFHPYAVTQDGNRFLLPVKVDRLDLTPITVVLGWQSPAQK
jgi:Tol biopolymer transport system component